MSSSRIGDTLGRYRLLEEVGQGGMAVVYRGEDTLLGREVAVKLLHPHLANLAESRARLEREAQAVAKLRHDNILEIFDYSPPESRDRYLVTEFIRGVTLTAFQKEHPIRFPEVAEMIAAEVTGALEHAHALGVIHRDVKPENVMIRSDGVVKLTDFGIAQIVDKEKLTVTGQLLGSPAYMSPEHIDGGHIDFRTDVFAAGILLYQLATGELPFKGKNPHEVLKKIAECRYTPPEEVNPRVSGRLARMIKRALERLPADRFQNVADLRKEILADLDEADVRDVRAELRVYFADPLKWEKEFTPRLVASLAANGRKLASAGRTAAAIGAWNRALTITPDDPTVRALVDGLARQRWRGRIALVAGTGAMAIAGLIVGMRLLGPHPAVMLGDHASPPGSGPNVSTVEAGPARSSAIPTDRAQPTPRKARGSTSLGIERAVHLATPVPPSVPHMVTIDSDIKRCSVQIDDGPMLGCAPFVTVPGGWHTLHWSSPCCGKKDYDIDDRLKVVKIVGEYIPPRVTIRTSPEGADITWVTKRDPQVRRATGGVEFSVPLDPKDGGSALVTVEVHADGYQTKQRVLSVFSGNRYDNISVDLDRNVHP